MENLDKVLSFKHSRTSILSVIKRILVMLSKIPKYVQ